MNSHELARLLLDQPNLPVAIVALGHWYASAADRESHGPLQVAFAQSYAGPHVVIGDMLGELHQEPNFIVGDYITDGRGRGLAHGGAPAPPTTPPLTSTVPHDTLEVGGMPKRESPM